MEDCNSRWRRRAWGRLGCKEVKERVEEEEEKGEEEAEEGQAHGYGIRNSLPASRKENLSPSAPHCTPHRGQVKQLPHAGSPLLLAGHHHQKHPAQLWLKVHGTGRVGALHPDLLPEIAMPGKVKVAG